MDFDTFFKEIGIDKMPEDQQQQAMQDIFETLSMRVTLRVGRELSPEQLQALEAASAKGDEEAEAEINRIYPGYDDVYREEMEKLKNELIR